MLPIKFISTLPDEPYVHAVALSVKRSAHKYLPELLFEALQRKPMDHCLELFMPGSIHPQRFLAMQLADGRRQTLEEAGAALFKQAACGIEKTLLLDLSEMEEALSIIVGMVLSAWRFHPYRTQLPAKETAPIEEIVVLCRAPAELERQFHPLRATVEGVLYARALTAEPANKLTPMAYAERVKELTALGIGVEILDRAAIEALGMHSLLAIAKGSSHPPAIAILQWKGSDSAPIALVGKGVCFDAGGLCLKRPQDQLFMKWDKAGAGAVAGTIKALALMEAPIHVIGVLGLIENMPDGASAKPGDVVDTMSGQTVEIVNTDAEGRLVLAEALWYAEQRYGPQAMIDLGTLTLETFASLGSAYAGLYSNDPGLAKSLSAAGQRSGDALWELPMGAYFAKQITSDIADMKNMGNELMGENGAAAEFLKRFVSKPWAHIDLAGACWSMEDTPLAAKGVNGFGVRLLVEWLLNFRSGDRAG